MSSFYTRFLEECTKKDVSPSHAAESSGLSRAAPSGWKKGALPSDVNLTKLAAYFDIPVSEFHNCDDIQERDNLKKKIQRDISNLTKELFSIEDGTYTEKDKKIPATESDGLEKEDDLIITESDKKLLRLLHAQSEEKRRAILSLLDIPSDVL